MLAGVFYFPTDYGIDIGELARAVEERGLESLFVCEHTHIPVSRKSPFPGGGELPKRYVAHPRPVRGAVVRGGGNQENKARHRHLPHPPARPDHHRQAGGQPRPALGRAIHLRHGRRLERRRDGEPRRQIRDALQAAARACARHEGAVDQGEGRIPRPARQLRSGLALSQAQAEAAPAAVPRRRERSHLEARGGVLRRLVPAGTRRLRSQGFGGAAAQGGDGRRPRSEDACRSQCSAHRPTRRSSRPIATPASSACCSPCRTAAATRSCACSTRWHPSPRPEPPASTPAISASAPCERRSLTASVIFGGI